MYDGAMGTMIQKEKLEEEDYRGERYKDVEQLMKGNNDMLSVTKPEVIKGIYKKYLEAGSNMIGTNTFSSTTIAQADYALEGLVYELNYHGARLAREACDEMTKEDPSNPRFVCGAVGPTNRTGSISPDVEDPASRNVTFDELVDAYYEQVVGLMDGGADILIVETIFDTLNAKAAVFAIGEYLEHTGLDIPLIVSGTLVDQSGRTLSGQTGEAFYASIRHSRPMCIGLNCALGAQQMAPFLERLSKAAECFVHVYSNAGLPNAFGEYDESSIEMGEKIKVMILEIDHEKRRISLGLKQTKPNPWIEFANKYGIGDKVEGSIKSITDFGIFVGLEGDIDGLIHLSDITEDDDHKKALEEYKKDQNLKCIVFAIDADRERISLKLSE